MLLTNKPKVKSIRDGFIIIGLIGDRVLQRFYKGAWTKEEALQNFEERREQDVSNKNR